jgi:hypothetical protein
LLSFTYKNPDQKKTSNKQPDIDQKIITKFYQLRQSYEMHASTLNTYLGKGGNKDGQFGTTLQKLFLTTTLLIYVAR